MAGPARSQTVLSPGEIAAKGPSGKVRVGGRVLAVSAATLALGDALSVLRVRLSSAGTARIPVEPGNLVVVEGTLRGSVLGGARVIEVHPGALGGAPSEVGRFIGDSVGANLVARAVGLRAIREYFETEGFLEVETPSRVDSPGLDAHVDAVRSEERFLITSPELAMKRLLVGGLPRVFQIARVHRSGELGPWHEPEFSMLEWYRAFAGMEDVLCDTESIVVAVARALTGRRAVVAPDGRSIPLRVPFERMTVREAYRRHAGVKDAVALASSDENRYFQLLVDQVEPGIAKSAGPVFLTEFPASQGALARRCAHDDTVVERFELYIGGIELCNGFGELTCPVEQRARFEAELERRRAARAPLHPIDEAFLAALAEGMPPAGGNALGLDRLLAVCLGARAIAELIAFPTAK